MLVPFAPAIRRAALAAAVLAAALLPAFTGVQAQSADAQHPSPLSAGVNRGTVDSLVGNNNFWTVYVNPGTFTLRFVAGNPGEMVNMGQKVTFLAQMNPKPAGATFVRHDGPGNVVTYTGTTPRRAFIAIGISPPNSKLIRQTVSYTLSAEGSADFAGAPAAGSAPSVTGIYLSKMNDHGTTKLLPGGEIVTSKGEHGHWELFDAGTRSYVVSIGRDRWDVTFQPGRGFVNTDGFLVLQLPQQ